MYTKPTDSATQIQDWENVLNATKDDPSILAWYAFHGVRSEVMMSLTYLTKVREHRIVNEDIILKLRELDQIRKKF